MTKGVGILSESRRSRQSHVQRKLSTRSEVRANAEDDLIGSLLFSMKAQESMTILGEREMF